LRCAWPSDRKGSHRVKDCIWQIKLDKGIASFPKAKEYQKMKVAGMELPSGSSSEDEDSENSENSGSNEGSDNSESLDDSEEEYEHNSERELEQETQEEGNWWDSP